MAIYFYKVVTFGLAWAWLDFTTQVKLAEASDTYVGLTVSFLNLFSYSISNV